MHRILKPRNILCHALFTITGEATSPVIGGSVLSAIALMTLVILLLGGLIYYKKRKSRKLHIRYSVIHASSVGLNTVIFTAMLGVQIGRAGASRVVNPKGRNLKGVIHRAGSWHTRVVVAG